MVEGCSLEPAQSAKYIIGFRPMSRAGRAACIWLFLVSDSILSLMPTTSRLSTRLMSSANPFTGYAKTNFSLSGACPSFFCDLARDILTPRCARTGASGLYDRARPRYPPAALEQIVSYLPKNANLVELGSGTGIFSRALLKTAEDAGKLGQLTAVEPAEGMRKGFQDKLFDEGVPASVKGKVEVVDGTFEKIPLGDASADLVGQHSFHTHVYIFTGIS